MATAKLTNGTLTELRWYRVSNYHAHATLNICNGVHTTQDVQYMVLDDDAAYIGVCDLRLTAIRAIDDRLKKARIPFKVCRSYYADAMFLPDGVRVPITTNPGMIMVV